MRIVTDRVPLPTIETAPQRSARSAREIRNHHPRTLPSTSRYIPEEATKMSVPLQMICNGVNPVP